MNKTSIAMEADYGTFHPLGITYSGDNPTAQCIVNEVMKLLEPIDAHRVLLKKEGSDIEALMDEGVPGSSLENENQKYFDFHHTNGDTMTVMDSHVLDLCTAVWAVSSYVFASLDDILPR